MLSYWIIVMTTAVLCTSCVSNRGLENVRADTPELAVRGMLRANEQRDLKALQQFVADDMVGYTIGGRRYDGWQDLAREMELEFAAVTRIEIPIKRVRTWQYGDVARYTVEIDYIRHEANGTGENVTVIPLRESGVFERRDGRWVLVQWHESADGTPYASTAGGNALEAGGSLLSALRPDLSGEWEIQEEDKSYRATLDAAGNGSYTWQEGQLRTTRLADGRWEGTWRQSGNDREGGFDVTFTGDGSRAQGRWWYTRVGSRSVPPRQWGGEYRLRRLTQGASEQPR